MSDDLKARFEAAVKESTQLPERPGNDTLLQIYSLYKQATEGDVKGEKPGFFDFKAMAKYEAWEKLKGMSSEKATQDYVDLIERLKKRYSS